MSTTNSRYTYRFLFSYPSATFLLHCCCSASSQLITSQWWCWRACLAATCLIKKTLHPQHQTHHFLDESSPPLWPLLHLCLDLVWSLYIIVPAGSALWQIMIPHKPPPKTQSDREQSEIYRHTPLHVLFSCPFYRLGSLYWSDAIAAFVHLKSDRMKYWSVLEQCPPAAAIWNHDTASENLSPQLETDRLVFHLEGLLALRRR